MRPLPATALGVIVAAILGLSTPARAETSCTYDAATFTVSVVSDDLLVLLAAPGGTITYTSLSLDQTTPPTESPCGGATTTNTDAIRVTGAGEEGILVLLLDISRGPFAPGMTAEPTGTSEIEVAFEPSVEGGAVVQGSEAPELVRFGTLGANINADDDVDVTLAGSALGFGFLGLGGDDDLASTGGLGTGDPATLEFVADGGAGADLLVGGPGVDNMAGGSEDDRLTGNAGADSIEGGSGSDVGSGGPGRDDLVGGGGGDILRGGPDQDSLNGGPGTDRCIGGPGKDTLERCER